ncbi:MAG: hypothetical protein Q9218_005713 [Villophora microphyllina]
MSPATPSKAMTYATPSPPSGVHLLSAFARKALPQSILGVLNSMNVAVKLSEAVMPRGCFTPIHEFFFAEDFDARGGCYETDGDADEEGHLRDLAVVDGRGEDGIGGEVTTAEIDAFGFKLRETD